MMRSIEERQALRDSAPSIRLTEVHTKNCQVIPTRMHMLSLLPCDGIVAELGVASGDFTKQILDRNNPKKLHLIDSWQGNRFKQGLEQVQERFSAEISSGLVEVNRGLSTECLAKFDDSFFDWIYIDTDHSYATTRAELQIAAQKLRSRGFIAGHDFTSGNPVRAVPYGVVAACNEFCVANNWEYAFLTLEPSGHFSFALRRIEDGASPDDAAGDGPAA